MCANLSSHFIPLGSSTEDDSRKQGEISLKPKGMKIPSLTSPIVTPVDLHSHSNIASESLGVKTNKLGPDWRGKFVLYYCIAIKVCLKHLNKNEEKKELFCKKVKLRTIITAYIVSL